MPQYDVKVPDGVEPGQSMCVETPGGKVLIKVPKDTRPGDVIKFMGPKPRPTLEDTGAGQYFGSADNGGLVSMFDPDEVLLPRNNAFQKPWSWRFCAGIFLVWLVLGLYSGLVCPLMQGAAEVALSALWFVVWIAMLVSSLLLVKSDPRDRGGDSETIRCDKCMTQVLAHTKHCWDCDECVNGFDHHCPWLNTCVGIRNYHMYLTCIITVFLVLALFVASTTIVACRLITEGRSLPMTPPLFCAVAVFLPFVQLDGMLIFFHCRLICRGMTTYEHWIGHKPQAKGAMLIRESDESAEISAVRPRANSSASSAFTSVPSQMSLRSKTSLKDLVAEGYHQFISAPMPAEPVTASDVLSEDVAVIPCMIGQVNDTSKHGLTSDGEGGASGTSAVAPAALEEFCEHSMPPLDDMRVTHL